MYIDEISVNAKLEFRFSYNGKPYELMDSCIRPLSDDLIAISQQKHILFVHPLLLNDRILNVDENFLGLRMIATMKEAVLPYRYEDISYKLSKLPDGMVCAVVKSDEDAEPWNRRDAYRFIIEVYAYVTIKGVDVKIFLKDISATGIGFECETAIPDKFQFEYDFGDFKLQPVECQVMRHDKNFYGATFSERQIPLEQYINRRVKDKEENAWRQYIYSAQSR